jgi:hypothetical protein
MSGLNKLAHAIILALFVLGCWFVWALLQLPAMVRMHGVEQHLPAFTTLCISWSTWVAVGLAIVATAHCLRVWFSKPQQRPNSWVAFLAAATGSLLLITFPIIIAIYLPLVDALQHVAAR